MLVDKDSYTSLLLLSNLTQRGFKNVKVVKDGDQLPNAVAQSRPDVVIFNYRFDEFDSLILCNTLKQISPQSIVIIIASPGPGLKIVESWAKQTKSIDLIFEKPLSNERFFLALEDMLKLRLDSRALKTKSQLLEHLVPEFAASEIHSEHNNVAKMYESAVLFTDIRQSTELIRAIPPREYFEYLNHLLSAQSSLVKQFEGSIIKYTGDGVMAIFKGAGRSYLALSCAFELAKSGHDSKLPFGTGVAEGLVLAGLIGDSKNSGQRVQYDVIGATVNLASRLCGMAKSGEVVITKKLNAVVKYKQEAAYDIGSLNVKGFGDQIDCVAFNPLQLKTQEKTT